MKADTKPTNPKDLIGSDKLPIHLWPSVATYYGCLGLLDGALKYGRANFRAIGVRASIYFDAALRHLNAWFEGEDMDPDSGLPHLGHALACLAILVDSTENKVLRDDRAYPGKYREAAGRLTPHVARLRKKYTYRHPKHYTIQERTSHGKSERTQGIDPVAAAQERAVRLPASSVHARGRGDKRLGRPARPKA